MNIPEWQQLEELIAEIQRSVTPDSEVRHNDKIRGRSGRLRQVDVTIRSRVGLTDVLIAIECKRQKRPVTIEQVEAFASKLRDIGASEGIIVSASGFAAGAEAMAREHRIQLLTFREAQDTDWAAVTNAESWLKIRMKRLDEAGARLTLYSGDDPVGALPLETPVIGKDGRELFTVEKLGQELELSTRADRGVGDFEIEVAPAEEWFVKVGGENKPITKIVMEGSDRAIELLVNLKLDSGEVLEEPGDSIPMYRRVRSAGFNWVEMVQRGARELTPEEFYKEDPNMRRAIFNLSATRPYLRVEFTQRKGQP